MIGLSDGNVWVFDTLSNYFLYKAKVMEGPIKRLHSTPTRIVAEALNDTKVYSWDMDKCLDNTTHFNKLDFEFFFSGVPREL